MITFALFTILMVIIGDTLGNKAIQPAMNKLVDAPSGGANLILDSRTPISNFIIGAFGVVIGPTIQSLNNTIFTTINLREMDTNSYCVLDAIKSVPSTDELRAIVIDARNTVSSSLNVANLAIPELDALTETFSLLEASATNGVSLLDGLSVSDQAVRDASDEVIAAFDDLLVLNHTLMSPSSSLHVGGITSNLTAITDPTTYPTTTELTDASSGINDLLAGTYDNNPTALSNLATRIQTVSTSLAGVPSPAFAASQLTSLNTYLQDTSLTPTIDAINNVTLAVGDIPAIAEANTLLANLTATFDRLDVGPLLAIVDDIEEIVNNASIVVDVSDQLDAVSGLLDVVPCLRALVQVVTDIDSDLLTIPSDFQTLDDTIDDIDVELRSALDDIDGFRTDLTNIQSDIDAFDVSQFADIRTTLNDLNTQISDARGQITSLETELAALDGTTTGLDLSPITSDISDLETSLRNPNLTPPASTLTDLTDLQTTIDGINGQLSSAASQTLGWVGATCVGSCTGCAGRTGEFCVASAAVVAGCCTADLDGTQLAATATALDNFDTARSDSTPDASAIITSMDSLATTASSVANPATDVDEINSILSSFSDVPISTSLDDINAILTDLDSSGRTEVADVRATLEDVQSSLVNVPNLDSILDDLDSVDDSLEQVTTDGRKHVDDFRWYLDQVQGIVYDDLFDYLQRLETSVLRAQFNSGGLSALARHLISLGQDIIERANRAQNTTHIDVNLLEESRDGLRVADILSQPNPAATGPVYFFLDLFDVEQIRPPYDTGFVNEYQNGTKYPDKVFCVTRACLERTIVRYNDDTLEGASDGAIPIPLSREDLMTYLYLLPALIAVIGLIPAVSFCGKDSRWQWYPTCISTTCMCLMMPLLFLITSFFFTMTMYASDMCWSWPNIGHQYVAGSLGGLCADFDGTLDASTGLCRVEMDIGIRNRKLDFNVDLTAVWDTVLGTCPDVVSDGPLAEAFEDLRANVVDVPFEELKDQLDQRIGETFEPLPPIRTILDSGANNSGLVAANLVSDFEEIFSCSGFNELINTGKDAMCCDVLTAMYWNVASWYLIAWAMLLCGCSGGILGCKRFPNKLWGYEFDGKIAPKAKPAAACVGTTGSKRFQQNPLHDDEVSPTAAPPASVELQARQHPGQRIPIGRAAAAAGGPPVPFDERVKQIQARIPNGASPSAASPADGSTRTQFTPHKANRADPGWV